MQVVKDEQKMKDYRLSEVKKHCETMKQKGVSCYACSLRYFCGGPGMLSFLICPRAWDIDEPIKTPSKDDIIAAVKQIIRNNGTFDEMGEIVTIDGNDIDHIAKQIKEEILKK